MLNPKSLLKVLPAVLLSVGQVVGIGEVVRSQPTEEVRSPLAQNITPKEPSNAEIDRLIQELKSGDCKKRWAATDAQAMNSIPSLIPLLKDENEEVRSA
jgi:hypothetical protein